MDSRSIWHPWHEMRRLQQQMEHVVSDLSPDRRWPRGGEYPPVNVTRDDDGHHRRGAVPGGGPREPRRQVVGDAVTIRGERKPDPACRTSTITGASGPLGAFTRDASASASASTRTGRRRRYTERHPAPAARAGARSDAEEDHRSRADGARRSDRMATIDDDLGRPRGAPAPPCARAHSPPTPRGHLRDRQGLRAPGRHARRGPRASTSRPSANSSIIRGRVSLPRPRRTTRSSSWATTTEPSR